MKSFLKRFDFVTFFEVHKMLTMCCGMPFSYTKAKNQDALSMLDIKISRKNATVG
jgi:hypothetical protein